MNLRYFLEKAYEKGVRDYLEENSRPYQGRVHVYDVLQCLRKSYWTIKKGQQYTSNYNLFAGSTLHIALESVLCKALSDLFSQEYDKKVEVVHEQEIDDGVLVGTPDIMILSEDKGYAVELKTTKFNIRASSSELVQKMHEKHIEQLQVYLGMIDRALKPVDHGILMYVDRRNGVARFETVMPNKRVYAKARSRAKKLVKCLENEKEPKPEPDVFCQPYVSKATGKIVSRCPFYDICPARKTLDDFGN